MQHLFILFCCTWNHNFSVPCDLKAILFFFAQTSGKNLLCSLVVSAPRLNTFVYRDTIHKFTIAYRYTLVRRKIVKIIVSRRRKWFMLGDLPLVSVEMFFLRAFKTKQTTSNHRHHHHHHRPLFFFIWNKSKGPKLASNMQHKS